MLTVARNNKKRQIPLPLYNATNPNANSTVFVFIKQLHIHAFGCMAEVEINTHLSHLRYTAAGE
jgi:hypothetical protein